MLFIMTTAIDKPKSPDVFLLLQQAVKLELVLMISCIIKVQRPLQQYVEMSCDDNSL